jgi:hypothetical protein
MLTNYEGAEDDLRYMLSRSALMVTFTKKDGTERVMLCTTAPSLLPDYAFPYNEDAKNEKPKTPGLVAVWDINSDGWRSFRFDSIISVSL